MGDIEQWMQAMQAELSELRGLRDEVDALRADNAVLRSQLAGLHVAPVPVASPATGLDPASAEPADAPGPLRPVSRRGMIAAVAGAAGGVLLTQATPAAAANGDPVKAGATTTATATTAVTTTTGVGVKGTSSSTSGMGVMGSATAGSGTNFGVWGDSASPAGRGVLGMATSQSSVAIGVLGQSLSTTGRGVYGYASAATGANTGVYGRSDSGTGFALFGEGRLKVTGRSFLATPNAAPSDADLAAGSLSFYLDQTTNTLKVRVRYTTGTLKTATIALA